MWNVICVWCVPTDHCIDVDSTQSYIIAPTHEYFFTPTVGDLTFCFNTLKAKLLKRCIDWRLFSSILGFAENYVSRVVREMSNDSTKDIADKFALFLDRFSVGILLFQALVYRSEVKVCPIFAFVRSLSKLLACVRQLNLMIREEGIWGLFNSIACLQLSRKCF